LSTSNPLPPPALSLGALIGHFAAKDHPETDRTTALAAAKLPVRLTISRRPRQLLRIETGVRRSTVVELDDDPVATPWVVALLESWSAPPLTAQTVAFELAMRDREAIDLAPDDTAARLLADNAAGVLDFKDPECLAGMEIWASRDGSGRMMRKTCLDDAGVHGIVEALCLCGEQLARRSATTPTRITLTIDDRMATAHGRLDIRHRFGLVQRAARAREAPGPWCAET